MSTIALLAHPAAAALTPASASPPDCSAAARIAALQAGLPAGLLTAIGVVETGRRDANGLVGPWPYAVDADGAGRWFADAKSAIAFAANALASGAHAVDIGCFQIDLEDHPGAFVSLAQGFDPAANAEVAAAFLSRLHARLGSWPAAIAAYHSATPARGAPYARLVTAAWHGGNATPRSIAADPYVIRLAGPPAALPRIVTP